MYVPNNKSESSENPNAAPNQSPVSSPLNYHEWLPQEIRGRRIPVPSNATPAEVIPWAKKFIARHKEIGTLIPENIDSYPAWKRQMDDWLQFLKRLEDLQNLAKNPPAPPPQQLPNLPASCQKLPKVANTMPDAARPLPKPGHSVPKPASASVDNPPPDEPPKDELELEYDDLMGDDFVPEHERLAVAREELHAHLADQPVRFAKLSPKQQAAVFSLLESGVSNRVVAKLLTEPPPIGASIRVSKTAVGDWRHKYKSAIIEERNRQKAEAQLQSALKILDNNPHAETDFEQAAERILKLRILTSEDAPLDMLNQLITSLTTLRKQALAERKQLHAENPK